jgi:hypothetical protein
MNTSTYAHDVIDRLPVRHRPDEMEDWIRRIQSEYFDMPGLRLTKPQIQRLLGLDSRRCDSLVKTLEASHFLRRMRDGAYVRADLAVSQRT